MWAFAHGSPADSPWSSRPFATRLAPGLRSRATERRAGSHLAPVEPPNRQGLWRRWEVPPLVDAPLGTPLMTIDPSEKRRLQLAVDRTLWADASPSRRWTSRRWSRSTRATSATSIPFPSLGRSSAATGSGGPMAEPWRGYWICGGRAPIPAAPRAGASGSATPAATAPGRSGAAAGGVSSTAATMSPGPMTETTPRRPRVLGWRSPSGVADGGGPSGAGGRGTPATRRRARS